MCPTSDAPKFHRDPRLLDIATWKLSVTSWKAIIPRHCRRYGCETLQNSSRNVYNSHWKAFTLWANNKGFLPSDLSYVTLAEYLVYLFSQHKKMNTIQVHKASISSVLKFLNPPTALPEETLHNVIRRMTILRPREQDVLPKWHLSTVFKGLMKPPLPLTAQTERSLWRYFYINCLLIALTNGARRSELVALSRASHNLEFTTLASGA